MSSVENSKGSKFIVNLVDDNNELASKPKLRTEVKYEKETGKNIVNDNDNNYIKIVINKPDDESESEKSEIKVRNSNNSKSKVDMGINEQKDYTKLDINGSDITELKPIASSSRDITNYDDIGNLSVCSKHSKHSKHSVVYLKYSDSDNELDTLSKKSTHSKYCELDYEIDSGYPDDYKKYDPESKHPKQSESDYEIELYYSDDNSKSKHTKHKHSKHYESDTDLNYIDDNGKSKHSKHKHSKRYELVYETESDYSDDHYKKSKYSKHSHSKHYDSESISGSESDTYYSKENYKKSKDSRHKHSRHKHYRHKHHSNSESMDSEDGDLGNLSNLNKLSPEEKLAIVILAEKAKQENKPKRIFWVDWLRIFSSILIVFVQCSEDTIKPKIFGSSNWVSLLIYNSLSKPCIPLFLMISSMLLLNPEKELSFKKIMTKYFIRAIKCYIAWSIYYNTIDTYIVNFKNVQYDWSWKQVGQTVLNIITAKNGDHLWYLKVIMVLYLATPLFRKLMHNRERAWYIAVIFMLVTQLFPTTAELSFDSLIKKLIEPLENSGSVVVYYIIGYLISTHEFTRKIYINYSYYIGVAGALLTIILRFVSSYVEKKEAKEFSSFGNINIGMTSYGIFMFFQYALSEKINNIMTKKNFINKAIMNLSDCSFGVYLIHMAIYHIFSRLDFHIQSLNPIYWTIIYTALLYLTSFTIIYCMKKIPLLKSIT